MCPENIQYHKINEQCSAAIRDNVGVGGPCLLVQFSSRKKYSNSGGDIFTNKIFAKVF
jgi:hypothetical protein